MLGSLLFSFVLGLQEPSSRVKLVYALPGETKFHSKLTMTYRDPEDELELIQKFDFVTSRLKSLNEDFPLQNEVTMTFEQLDGVQRPIADPKPAVHKVVRTSRGMVREFEDEGNDPAANLWLNRLLTVPFPTQPPALGDEWQWTDHRENPYKIVAILKQVSPDRAWVGLNFSSEATPITATGTGLVDLKTGWPMKFDLKIKNITIPGGDGSRVSATLLWETEKIAKQ